jgi:hypothetical protein
VFKIKDRELATPVEKAVRQLLKQESAIQKATNNMEFCFTKVIGLPNFTGLNVGDLQRYHKLTVPKDLSREEICKYVFIRECNNITGTNEKFDFLLKRDIQKLDIQQKAYTGIIEKWLLNEDQCSTCLNEEQFLAVWSWFYILTYGVQAESSSNEIDEVTKEAFLLRDTQKRLYNWPAHSKARPVLVCGDFGTGKTFIALRKLLKLGTKEELNCENKAVVIFEHHNICLMEQIQQFLESHKMADAVDVLPVEIEKADTDNSLILFTILESLFSGTTGYRYIIVDDQVKLYLV